MTLQIGPTMVLPDEWVSHRSALLAMSGAGKSNGVVVIAEAMYDVGLPFTIVDPKGDVYGIRSSADGKAPGLSIPIFGGLHGDVPLEPTAGAYIADLIFDHDLTCLLDVSQFSKGEMVRFLAEFGERLYRRHQAERKPRHVFIEEAEEPIAQSFSTKTDGGYMARCVGAWNKIAKLGRAFGLGVTMATQRSAGLNKNALTQVESLIILRTAGPQDLAAIKGWLQSHGAALTKEILDSLPSLGNGEAWMVSPHVLGKVERFTFRRRRTFDSGATPKLGEKPAKMTTLAEVDFAAIKDAMAETIERAKADDPKELRKRIAELERQLRDRPAVEPEIIHWRVDVVPPHVLEIIEAARGDLTVIDEHLRQAIELADRVNASAEPETPVTGRPSSRPQPTQPAPRARPVVAPARPAAPTAAPAAERRPAGDGATTFGGTERKILAVLVQHGPRDKRQLALQSGYSVKASTIGVALGKLRRLGYVEPNAPIRATPSGVEALGDFEPLPTGRALLDYWRSQLDGTSKNVLDAMLGFYPNDTTKEEIAAATGYSPAASTIGVALGRLRRLELVDGWRLSDDFAHATGMA